MPWLARVTAAVLAAAVLDTTPALAWPHDPATNVRLDPTPLNVAHPQVIADGAGGTFVTWMADGGASGTDLRAQRLDARGRALWAAGGVVVCNANAAQQWPILVADDAGGLIVVWQDDRSGAATSSIYAQRLGASGVPQWATNGVPVCASGFQTSAAAIDRDPSGGVIVAWTDSRNAGLATDIYVQRLGPTGAPVFTVNGVPACTFAGVQRFPKVAANGSEGFVVAWDDVRSGTSDVYANRISPGGFAYDGAAGVSLCSAPGQQFNPSVASDGQGNAVIAWADYRAGANPDIYAQLFTAFGQQPWGTDGLPVCVASGRQDVPQAVFDGEGHVLIGWHDFRAANGGIYVQKLDLSGAALFAADGLAVRSTSGTAAFVSMARDGVGGALIAWEDSRGGAQDIYAQRIRREGVLAWQANGVKVGTASGAQTAADIAPDGLGGAVVVFNDARAAAPGPSAQGVDAYGFLGGEPTISAVRDVPNDQGSQVKLSWLASPLDTDPFFYNVNTYYVFRSVPPHAAQARVRGGRISNSPAEVLARPARSWLWARPAAAQAYFWELVGYASAFRLPTYSLVVATEGDSVAGSNPCTAFMVMAITSNQDYLASEPDSGYSVDNLAPAAPAPFLGTYAAGVASLHWDPNDESDIAGYRLYRGTTAGFVPVPANRVSETSLTSTADAAGAPYWYKLTAVDTHGNESPATTLLPSGTVGVADGPAPATLALVLDTPGPVRLTAGARLRLAVPRAGAVTLRVHDAQGRLVRVLASGAFAAGHHVVRWDGRDESGRPAASGLYFARVQCASGTRVLRLSAMR